MQSEIKKKLLKSIIASVPFDGWSLDALHHGAVKAGYDQEYAELVFAGGVREALDLFIRGMDEEMLAISLQEKGISRRIKEMLVNRIRIIAGNKPLAARTVSFLSLPWNMAFATRLLWRTVDIIWHEAGNDNSTDYNYYTKRALLASVYTSSVMHMLSDDSKDLADTLAFIDRRFAEVAKLGAKLKPSSRTN